MCALQIEIGPSKSLISPKAMQFSVTASGQLADLNHMRIDYEATTCGIGERRQLNGGAVLGLHTHGKIMCQGGSEYQRCAFDREHQCGSLQTKRLVRIHSAKR